MSGRAKIVSMGLALLGILLFAGAPLISALIASIVWMGLALFGILRL